MTGEVLVVVRTLGQRKEHRQHSKTEQENMYVVRALLLKLREGVEDELREAALITTGLRNQRQVRRSRTAVGGAGSLFIRERRGEVIRHAARTLKHVAGIVRAVLD